MRLAVVKRKVFGLSSFFVSCGIFTCKCVKCLVKSDYESVVNSIIRKRKCMLPKDPIMLLSYVNMKLRDYYSSLKLFCEDLDVDEQEVMDKLSSIGYHYNEKRNQFLSGE